MRVGLRRTRSPWLLPALSAFFLVTLAQLWLVAGAGTDIPFQDQWDQEGAWLYPAYLSHTLSWARVLAPYNENRLVWTHLLNLGLFALDGQWDPLVQLGANAVLHGIVAALAVWSITPGNAGGRRWFGAGMIGILFLPGVSWANALWGFQSQVYFVLIFAIPALTWLSTAKSRREKMGGWLAMIAATLAMGPGLVVPVALVIFLVCKAIARRRITAATSFGVVAGLLLFAALYFSRAPSNALANLRPKSLGEFFLSLRSMLGFPFVESPFAALVVQLPLCILVFFRLSRRDSYGLAADRLIALGIFFWMVAIAAAAGRGGASDFGARVPWRYVDFCTLGVATNAGAAIYLTLLSPRPRRNLITTCVVGWGAVVLLGWTAMTSTVWRGVIHPRWRDRDVPVRLIREYQRTGDISVFSGQPRLLIPHPNLPVVRRVLTDPLMQGHLPPSLQPDLPLGPLSRAVRWILRYGYRTAI